MVAKCFLVSKIGEKVEQCDGGGTITRPIYRMPDGREFFVMDLPLGAMFVKDNGSLVIRVPRTPDWSEKTFFCPDEEKDSGVGWTRTGEPPDVTVQPSVFVSPPHGGHGFIRNGEIVNA